MVTQTRRVLSKLDVQDQADQVLTRYAVRRSHEAVKRAEAIVARDRSVCKCSQCVHRIAHEANTWLAFLEPSLPELRVERRYEPEFERGRWRLHRTVSRTEPIAEQPDYPALDQPGS